MTNFKTAARLGGYLAKPYAEAMFQLLVNYQDISASEAASRLNLHIRTAQEFLEGMAELEILLKEEVHEKKRPYYRYSLKKQRIRFDLDLSQVRREQTDEQLNRRIRERPETGARFSVARSDSYISSVAIWTGQGRQQEERKISLTQPQGRFLYHLPFPQAEPLTIDEIMRQAELEAAVSPEILDIVTVLESYGIVEVA